MVAPPRSLGPGRKALYGSCAAAALLACLELTLGLLGIEREDRFVAFAGRVPLFVESRAADGALWMETAPAKLRFFNAQRFRMSKPAGVRRIFCLGGSTTYGHPYDDRTSFCGFLRAFLRTADPEHGWEVINAAGISYASYREAALMQELATYEPDLFILHTGHNEFLERRSYPLALHPVAERVTSLAARTRTFSLVSATLAPPRRTNLLPAEVDAILDRSVGPEAYTRDDRLRASVLEHFRDNLTRMARLSAAAGARTLIVVPASNLSDCSPFRSQPSAGLASTARERLRALREQASIASDAGQLAEAEARWRDAAALDPRDADVLYRLARVLEARGSGDDAERFFVRARDEDVCSLRALSDIERIAREVASAEGALQVDFAALLRARSLAEHGTPAVGAHYFLDHVHPTIAAHRMLAEAVLETLVHDGWVSPWPDWNAAARARVAAEIESGVDARREGVALRTLAKVLSWAGKSEEAARVAGLALGKLGRDAESSFILGAYELERGVPALAVRDFRESIALDPDYARAHTNLGIALARSGQGPAARAEYDAALRLDPKSTRALYNRAQLALESGDRDQAIADYRQLLALDPTDAEARSELERLTR